MNTSESVVDWNRQPRRTSVAAQHVRVGQIAVVRDREAAELEIGIQRLDVAQDRVAGGGIAVVADRASAPGSDAITLRVAEIVADQAQAACANGSACRRS